MGHVLDEHLAAFSEQLPELLKTNCGEYAVGRAGDEFSCYVDWEAALQVGSDRYGFETFLVRPVVDPRFERSLSINGLVWLLNSSFF